MFYFFFRNVVIVKEMVFIEMRKVGFFIGIKSYVCWLSCFIF